ncbi:MAG: hypothetical protein RR047_01665 [Bacilli bacterium]
MKEVIEEQDFNELKRQNNGLLLTDQQVSILEKNRIPYLQCSNLRSLVFLIETVLNSDPGIDETGELEALSSLLAEDAYYQETNY